MRKAKIWAIDVRNGDVICDSNWEPMYRITDKPIIQNAEARVTVGVVGVGNYVGVDRINYRMTSEPNIRVMIS